MTRTRRAMQRLIDMPATDFENLLAASGIKTTSLIRKAARMTPPRRPRGEKPATTIRYQRQQIQALEQVIAGLRIACSDKEKVIAGYDVQLSEADDQINDMRGRGSDRAIQLAEAMEKLRQSTERTAFLEGYYAKSQESLIGDHEALSVARASLARNPASPYSGASAGNPQDLQNGRQAGEGRGQAQSAERSAAGTGDPLRRHEVRDQAYPPGRAVEHIEISDVRDAPREYDAKEIDALTQRYRDGEFSETVFRASLKTWLPPDETDHLIRLTNERIREIHRRTDRPHPKAIS